MKIILSSNTEWYLYNFRLPLARFLRDEGWEVVLLSPPGPYAQRLQEDGFRWIPWNLGSKTMGAWREWAAIQEVTRIYRAEKPDAVHHNTIKPSIYGSIAARRAGVPAIVNSITGRGYVFLGVDAKARLLRELVHMMYRYAFAPQNVRAIFENDTDRQYFIDNELIDRDQTVLIESSGVDPAVYQPAPEPEGVPVLMMAARMLWDKGVGVLVDAARQLKSRQEVRIVLVGDPDPGNPNSIPEETLHQWQAEGVVEWWGFRSDMNATLAESHIFTLPTMYAEGLPISILEAAACGRPIVTTTMPGCRDFVDDGVSGFLVPPGDVGALAGALEKLIVDRELRGRMGAAGLQRFLDGYTSGQVNERTLAVYMELLA